LPEQRSFPETLAQNVLMKGLDKPKLRDEAYLQVMKQLAENPKPDSLAGDVLRHLSAQHGLRELSAELGTACTRWSA
jgi:MyTH4 domain